MNILHMAAAAAALVIAAAPALAVTASVPTAGVAVTSFVVGAAATTESAVEDTRSKWQRKLLGFGGILLMGIDPDSATYVSGQSVIAYPDALLQFQTLIWYGPFSDGATGDPGPVAGPGAVQGSGFFDDVPVIAAQGPNPALTVTASAAGGMLSVLWSANPGIMTPPGSVNIFAAVFRNISGGDLAFATTAPGAPDANLRQETALQSLVCIPPGETDPVGCGYPDEPIGFSVSQVPLPAAIWPLGVGLLALAGAARRRAPRS